MFITGGGSEPLITSPIISLVRDAQTHGRGKLPRTLLTSSTFSPPLYGGARISFCCSSQKLALFHVCRLAGLSIPLST